MGGHRSTGQVSRYFKMVTETPCLEFYKIRRSPTIMSVRAPHILIKSGLSMLEYQLNSKNLRFLG